MKTLGLPVAALLLLAVTILVHWQHYEPLLPDQVATHIDASGRANQWTTKASFVREMLLFLAIAPTAIVGLGLLSCLAVLYLPAVLVNVPNKDYWLADRAHRRLVCVLVMRFFLWFLFAFVVLIYFGAMRSLVEITLHPELNRGGQDMAVVATSLLFIFAQVGLMIYRLFHPPPEPSSDQPATNFES